MNVAMIPPMEQLRVPWTCPRCQENAAACRERTRQNAEFITKVALLSDRERQVMLAICAGNPPKKTAARLKISIKTIHTYRARLMEKLELKSNVAIVLACKQAGILDE